MYVIQPVTSVFNPRECAILTLALLTIVFALFFRTARKGVNDLAAIFFSKKLFGIYALMIVYATGWIYVLYVLHLWDMALLKETIKWFLFAASVMFFNVQEFQKGKDAYIKTFREIFTGSTLMEFFTGKFSFSYLTELILIPVVTLLVLMRLLTQKDKEHSQVDKLLRRVLALIGFYFLGHIIYMAITEWHIWGNMDSLKEFLLAPILSILLLPFIFFLTVYMTYETQFMVLANKLRDLELLRYTKLKAFIAFGLDQLSLARWQSRLRFDQVTTKEQLITSIKDLKITQAIEKQPPLVAYDSGWSPYEAKDFLKPVFITKYYDPCFEDNWLADSNLVYIGEKHGSNYFRYKVLGNADAATALELELIVMAPLDDVDTISPLLAYADILYKNAMRMELPIKMENAIIKEKNCKLNVNGTKIRFSKEIWKGTLNNCYSTTLGFYRGKPITY